MSRSSSGTHSGGRAGEFYFLTSTTSPLLELCGQFSALSLSINFRMHGLLAFDDASAVPFTSYPFVHLAHPTLFLWLQRGVRSYQPMSTLTAGLSCLLPLSFPNFTFSRLICCLLISFLLLQYLNSSSKLENLIAKQNLKLSPDLGSECAE